jgi:2,3-dihydroxy-p-cumate/2,3-dihydroxybenzoate 3,4-dioxygenase
MPADFRYKGMGYIALNVTDIDKTTAFATEVFALTRAGEGPSGERFFRCSPNHHDVVLYPAKKAGFVRAGWELETQDDVEQAFRHFHHKLGLNPQWIPEEERAALGLNFAPAFRVREPTTRAQYDYYAKMQFVSAPLDKTHITRFKCFGHFGLVVPNCRATTEYMVENMGFLVSDYAGPYLATLMRAFPNPNHHSFAPIQHPNGKCTFHHMAFMVSEIDDIGKLFNRCKKSGTGIAFGIGRHPTSGSIHLYVYDPDSMVWEYTLGMEQFPETNAREARNMSIAPENFDLWGAVPDPGFLQKGADVVTED